MKRLFPKGVELMLGESGAFSNLVDVDSGETVENVKAIEVKVDADHRGRLKIVLTLCAMALKVRGPAEYKVDAETLELIAKAHGYKLVPIEAGA